MLNSLYLSYDGLTDPLGQSQILPYLLGLEAKGIAFHVISFEKKENYLKEGGRILELISDKNIIWHPLPYHKNPPVLSTVFDLYRLRRRARQIIKENKVRIVHCRSYVTSLTGLWLKKKFGLKFIFDMRGFWADERVEGGLWDLKNPIFRTIYRYFKQKEKQFFREADAVISLTENAKLHITGELNHCEAEKISVIPCCADLDLFCQSGKADDKISLNPDNRYSFKLLYLGSLGTWYLFEEMYRFFKFLAGLIPNSQFLLVTNDVAVVQHKLEHNGWILSEHESFAGNPLFHFTHSALPEAEVIATRVPRHRVPDFIRYSDASIMFIKPSFSKKASSATKMGEVLAMGKPVITNAGWGDVELFKSKIEDLYVVEDFNKAEYEAVVQKLLAKKITFSPPSTFALEYFSLKNGAEKYFEVYRRLSGEV